MMKGSNQSPAIDPEDARIDWPGSIAAWIAEVESELLPRLEHDVRFINSGAFAARFRACAGHWRQAEAQGGNTRPHIRSLIEDGNEVAAAVAILDCMEVGDSLHYEPRLANTEKSLDFLVRRADGARLWFDVKSIRPQWNDSDEAWERFLAIAEEFPPNARLIVDRRWAGAALSAQALKTRWSFIRYALDIEQKAAFLTPEEQGPVRLVLCSDRTWNADDLEDFADFYHTGRFREDDWSRNAVSRFIQERGIAFTGALAGFCYLQRSQDATMASRFLIDVRGPAFLSAEVR